jgi:hypothetical protein
MKKGNKAIVMTSVLLLIAVVFLVLSFLKKDMINTANINSDIESDNSIVSDTQSNDSISNTNDTSVVSYEGQVRSMLTGEWVDEDTARSVPVAVMYSNIYDAMPQSSISYADVVFESLVEGGITRLCCLFENQTQLEKIGPVRSCRTYYLMFAKEFEANYVHFGYSEYAEKYLKQSKFHSLDGMVYCNFYRTDDRVAPHNAYTSWDGIMESVKEKGYQTVYTSDYTSPFTFNTDDNKDIVIQNGQDCSAFYVGYPYNKPWFEYDNQTKTYKRFQFEAPQIDELNGQQLAYKNILVKYVEPQYYDNGTPNYKVSGTGKGLYITDGKAVEVTWVKRSETEGATRYYYSNGEEVILNQGKTYICQVESTQEVNITYEQ